ncbi:16S rRNA (guanine(966)-N(2))-methyltransferase RsmD [Sphingomonas sinipercae]|uniref:16S rRNA (Guanine(966)-N(2))-methyltransferase RsmD n=1 Tax=Sphingomonas sinipercae TaxID=2714944 RepID=A0A6G7ZN11_9SPHN|nr:16S rRNA (guanine(966)-N(2))-methyltransferase RsmD [Sphingomonas sinipercae]QIL02300.1 16S rRNA (guanine(966)-N(2))-methyltransferase RsmD [Sphingomonas sinipercae]
MRIVAGQWRGRRLAAPAGSATRPTADRVRETLFSMLASRLGSFDELRVADLYAGSGALGFEALSRGAAFACFVEQDRGAIAAIRSNIAVFAVQARTEVLGRSATSLPPSQPFDLIFADPPYAAGSGSAVVAEIVRAGWLAPGGWAAIETQRGDPVDRHALELDSERDVGRARLTLLRRAWTSPPT